MGETAALADPDLVAVPPHAEGGFHPVESQDEACIARKVRRDVDAAPVVARGVRVGHVRRIDGEGELHVRVDGAPVPTVVHQHPRGRYRDAIPRGHIGLRLREGIGVFAGRMRRRQQAERPVAGQIEPRGIRMQP
jgi:hypothetical protein